MLPPPSWFPVKTVDIKQSLVVTCAVNLPNLDAETATLQCDV